MQRVYDISICLIAVSGESTVDLDAAVEKVEKIVFQLPTQPLSPSLIISNVQVKDVGGTWHLMWTCLGAGGRVSRRPRRRRSVNFFPFSPPSSHFSRLGDLPSGSGRNSVVSFSGTFRAENPAFHVYFAAIKKTHRLKFNTLHTEFNVAKVQ